ncbi:hypothetical protein NEUTE1DRAFT_130647 [Neurospora tetrasperma FGSC 2508]|uniref:Uncharacterized protein n=1 Tax=Neurospora tetrasperma (strain FGSC 2508 / ATCC MYA-4615 / P0657) TaxID=510951 RepID=F8MR34_NEUT8|nr:uncharacterized protein NEUTE1DRAFT_130647 [Neurospora tetrasperma FGSC 2508]EGO56814.1 hypothetical protein NEUTE1DRAFT_130647 [Neurospora tetrasperma FGSC 2508]EGZ70296.1 hypothetical protein NEUTE2DRAFT_158751 [Neurospora tetrasperma FGSC 2509]
MPQKPNRLAMHTKRRTHWLPVIQSPDATKGKHPPWRCQWERGTVRSNIQSNHVEREHVRMSSHSECFPSLHASFSMVARNGHVGEVGSSSTYKDLGARLRSGKVDSLFSLLIWIFKSHHHRHRPRHHASYYQESETTVGGQPCHHPSARTAFNVLSQPYWWFPSDTVRGPVALSLLRL